MVLCPSSLYSPHFWKKCRKSGNLTKKNVSLFFPDEKNQERPEMSPGREVLSAPFVSTTQEATAFRIRRIRRRQIAAEVGFGDVGCWFATVTYESCCDLRLGPRGAEICWDQIFTFERCCRSDGKPRNPGNSSRSRAP